MANGVRWRSTRKRLKRISGGKNWVVVDCSFFFFFSFFPRRTRRKLSTRRPSPCLKTARSMIPSCPDFTKFRLFSLLPLAPRFRLMSCDRLKILLHRSGLSVLNTDGVCLIKLEQLGPADRNNVMHNDRHSPIEDAPVTSGSSWLA